jgi:hypothetical protein
MAPQFGDVHGPPSTRPTSAGTGARHARDRLDERAHIALMVLRCYSRKPITSCARSVELSVKLGRPRRIAPTKRLAAIACEPKPPTRRGGEEPVVDQSSIGTQHTEIRRDPV